MSDEPTMGEPGDDPYDMEFDTPALAAARVVEFGRYSLSRYPQGAWEFSDGSLGATGRGPIRAFLHWRRWQRDYHAKPLNYWAQ